MNKGLWATVIFFILAVYALSPLAPAVRALLGDELISYLTIVLATTMIAGAFFWTLFNRQESMEVYGWLIIIVLTLAYMITKLHITEISNLIIYSIFTVMVFYAAKKSKLKHPYIISLIIVSAASILDEIIQLAVPGRHFELMDIELSIATGILMTILFYIVLREKTEVNNMTLTASAAAFLITLFSKDFAGYTVIIMFLLFCIAFLNRMDLQIKKISNAKSIFFIGIMLAIFVLTYDLLRGRTTSIGMLQIIALVICTLVITKSLESIRQLKRKII